MPIRCVVLFAKDYFLLRAKAISGKGCLADQHKGLTQKIFGVDQRFLNDDKSQSSNYMYQLTVDLILV